MNAKKLAACLIFISALLINTSLSSENTSRDKILQITKSDAGAQFKTESGLLRINFETPEIVRIHYTRNPKFSAIPSLMRIPIQSPKVKIDIEKSPQTVVLRSPKLAVKIDRTSGAVSYLDASGNLLLTENQAQPRHLEPRPISVAEKEILTKTGPAGLRDCWKGRINFKWQDGEALYGLGYHEEGFGNLRGTMQYLYQHDLKVVIPVLVSTKGYGLLFDNYSAMEFHDDSAGSFMQFDMLQDLDYYFIYGPDFDRIVSCYRLLTGKAQMLPKWAFGFIQSRSPYKTQAELLDVAKEFRARHLPLDCIMQDYFYWPDTEWNEMRFDPNRYPDPAGMVKTLHDMNVKFLISVWPNCRGGSNEQEVRKLGLGLPAEKMYQKGIIYNPFNPKARDLFWKHIKLGLGSYDIDAWWTDCTEPVFADYRIKEKLAPGEHAKMNTQALSETNGPFYPQAFSLMQSKGFYEHYRRDIKDKRLFNLTRSFYAGQQRYAAFTWDGDTSANWNELADEIACGLNFMVTGAPYWTFDIGAFWTKDDPITWFTNTAAYPDGVADLGYREIYVRWFQLGTFAPVFRSHGMDTPREPWQFGQAGTPFYDAQTDMLKLRYRLMPYIYSLAGWTVLDDYTMFRYLAFDFHDDPAVYNIKDQFMFGPAFMVCPVLKPMYYDVNSVKLEGVEKTRKLYLPKGSSWCDFWTGKLYTPGQVIAVDAPLNKIPLLVKAGSVIPFGPDLQYASEKPADPIELRIYPGADGKFMLYEDQGDNYNYEKGAFSQIPIRYDDAKHTVTIEARKGSFPGMLKKRTFNIVLVTPENGLGIEPAKPLKTISYTGSETSCQL